MKTRQRWRRAPSSWLAIALVAAILAACGGDDARMATPSSTRAESTPTSRETVTQQATPAAAVPAPSVTPTVTSPTTVEEVNALEASLDDAGEELTIYWLGLTFEPGAALPALVLGGAVAAEPGGPGYALTLEYRLASEPSGASVVTFMEWPRATWDSGMGASVADFWEQMPCHDQQAIELSDGQATLYMGYENDLRPGETCENVAFSRYGAIATLGDTVVQIDAPGVFGPQGELPSPYNTREGMEVVLAGLTAHQPRAGIPAPTATPPAAQLPTPAPGEALEPVDVFALIEAALRRPGLAYHATVTQVIVYDDGTEPWWSAEIWLDGERHLGRAEHRLDSPTSETGINETTSIYANGIVHFMIPDKGPGLPEAPGCHGVPEASISAFLLCWSISGNLYELLVVAGTSSWDGLPSALMLRVEQEAVFEEQPALAVVFELDPEAAGESAILRLYVDRETYLPLAWVNDSYAGGQLVRRFEHEFIGADTLPAGFFDPETLGP